MIHQKGCGALKRALKSRKGYYFIIDALIGSTIIVISLILILNTNQVEQPVKSKYLLAEEFSSFIINNKIEDLNDPYISTLIQNGDITNTKNTIMEQITEFYYKGNISLATNLTRDIADSVVTGKNGFSYTIGNTTIYNRSVDRLNSSKLVVTSKKITYLLANATTMFGPEISEVKIWI